MATTTTLTIRAGGMETEIPGSQLPGREPCLFLTQDYVEGWHGTPQIKLDLTELAMGDGAAAPQDGAILYAARTCTAHVIATGRKRSDVLAQAQRVNRFAHRICTIELADSTDDTMAVGCYVSAEWDSERHPTYMTGTITIVCPDPRRYGSVPHRAWLSPGASAGALGWHVDVPHGLLWPLSYGGGGAGSNVATLRNDGTSTAYPVITASGDMDSLVLTNAATGAQLAWDGHVGAQPVTLDCLSRTASVAGVDASRLLSARGFPSVPAVGEVTLALTATGAGTVSVEWRNTYI